MGSADLPTVSETGLLCQCRKAESDVFDKCWYLEQV